MTWKSVGTKQHYRKNLGHCSWHHQLSPLSRMGLEVSWRQWCSTCILEVNIRSKPEWILYYHETNSKFSPSYPGWLSYELEACVNDTVLFSMRSQLLWLGRVLWPVVKNWSLYTDLFSPLLFSFCKSNLGTTNGIHNSLSFHSKGQKLN